MTQDYRSTLFLPQTDFPMRGNLPQKEPTLLARWESIDLYQRTLKAAADRPSFTLHDGPPYANGNLHLGHALNKILKDIINRSQFKMGGRFLIFQDGIAMVCQLKPRWKKAIAKKEKTKTTYL